MEKTKVVKINDLNGVKIFQIRLFDALTGLDFLDEFIATIDSQKKSIKPLLKDLLPLATQMDASGTRPVQPMSLDIAGSMIESPLAIVELGLAILDFQQVFMDCSPRFRQFKSILQNMFPAQTSESVQ